MKVVALVALSFVALAASDAHAQSPAPANAPAKPSSARAKSSAAYDPLAESKRATAISLVNALADEARSFHDETLRARVQARAADALWETDQERARALFRRAWDAADLADKEIARKIEEDKRRQLATGGSVMLTRPANLRSEVLRLAAKRDRALGEEFLSKLDEQRKQDERDAAAAKLAGAQTDAPARNTPAGLSFDDNHRLDLARDLLQAGDAERALQFAEPALQTVTRDSVFFLADLREKSPDAADRIFASMLARAAADPASDANTVSTLSSYAFTPHLLITIDRDGGFSTTSNGQPATPENFPAALRLAFLQTAAQVLLRPAPPADQDRTSGGRAATYFIIARLLPVFDQYLPAAGAPLRAQLTALTPDVPQGMRDDANNRWLTEGLRPRDEQRSDDLQSTLDKIDNAKTDEERDDLYAQAAMTAASQRDPRARDFAASVKSTEVRDQLLPFIDFMAADQAVQKKDVPEILRVARNGAMTHIQNVWALTEAARLSVKENRPLALDLLEEALQEARRTDGSDADRPRALLAVLTPLYDLDPSRVWSLMTELVKAANSASDFTGEDGRLLIKFRTKHQSSIHSSTVDRLNVQPLFRLLEHADLDRAVEFAKSFTNEAPRASASLAVAAAALADTATKPDAAKPRTKT